MTWNRRELLRTMGGAVSALALSKLVKAQAARGMAFAGTRHSLEVRHLVALGAAVGDRTR